MSGGWGRRSMNGYTLVESERNEMVLFNVHEQFVSSPCKFPLLTFEGKRLRDLSAR